MITKTNKITLGTREWADSNVNCYFGCSNDCRYCYAKKMAIRFKRKTEETWTTMIPNEKNIAKRYNKRKGRVMFPSSHDITMESISGCLKVLEKLIDAKNDVLITTKPNLYCIQIICKKFLKQKDLIQFRFTITSTDIDKTEFWEPNAPPFEERFQALKFAYNKKFKTSISIEPFLDRDPYDLVEKLKPYVTESIWIGKMNYIKATDIQEENKDYYNDIREITNKENLSKIYKKSLKYDNRFLRLKDSIYNFLFA